MKDTINPTRSISDDDKIWIVAHAFITTLLRIYREHGFRMTKLKSWDFIKWNALGSPMVSRLAVEKFFSERLPDGSLLKKGTTVKEFTSGREKRGRCFVAEHVYPTKALQDLVFTRFACVDPSPVEVRELCIKYNRICYVWYEEDKQLTENQLRSSIPKTSSATSSHHEDDPLLRYRAKGIAIEALETTLGDGHAIFRALDQCRARAESIEYAIRSLDQPS